MPITDNLQVGFIKNGKEVHKNIQHDYGESMVFLNVLHVVELGRTLSGGNLKQWYQLTIT